MTLRFVSKTLRNPLCSGNRVNLSYNSIGFQIAYSCSLCLPHNDGQSILVVNFPQITICGLGWHVLM